MINLRKVFVHDDDHEEIHFEQIPRTPWKTLCGRRLHAINTVHINKMSVTCEKCMKESLR